MPAALRMTDRSAIVVFSHGAKDPEWARPVHRIQAAVERLLPAIPVEVAFLELMDPTLDQAVSRLVAAGVKRITIVPLFLAVGGHIKRDLPLLIADLRSLHPEVQLIATPPIGEDEELLGAIAAWVVRKHQVPMADER